MVGYLFRFRRRQQPFLESSKMKSFRNSRIKLQHKLMALFLVLSLTPLAIVGYIAYNDRESYLKEDIGSKLESNAKNTLTILNSLLANEKRKIQDLTSTDSFKSKIANVPDPGAVDALLKFNKKK